MLHDIVFQWITDHFPTEEIQTVKFKRNLYRLLLNILRPRGKIRLRTSHYQLYFSMKHQDLAYYIALKRPWEPFETAVFLDQIKPGMRVFDIGANIGHYTLVASQRVGSQGRVYAFEPVPTHFLSLTDNLALNGIFNVQPFPLACGDKDGEMEIHIDGANPGGHSISSANLIQWDRSLTVKTTRLDTMLDRLGRDHIPDLIKIDTEGAEGAIINGALETLSQRRPILLLEFWPYAMNNCGWSAEGVLETLTGMDYRFHIIDERRKQLRSSIPEALIAEFPREEKTTFTNLLALPVG